MAITSAVRCATDAAASLPSSVIMRRADIGGCSPSAGAGAPGCRLLFYRADSRAPRLPRLRRERHGPASETVLLIEGMPLRMQGPPAGTGSVVSPRRLG